MAVTLAEAGVQEGAELWLVAEWLTPDEPVGLTIEDDEGERFATAVQLNTPVGEWQMLFWPVVQRVPDGSLWWRWLPGWRRGWWNGRCPRQRHCIRPASAMMPYCVLKQKPCPTGGAYYEPAILHPAKAAALNR